jgi:tetratricopeptide (TPR) repeat protein/tRNA A-37 threonylcarbamoyl transferase component Bud32
MVESNLGRDPRDSLDELLRRCRDFEDLHLGFKGPPSDRRRRMPPTLDGATLGDFRIIEEIGRGGMGVVYLAEQTSLGRRVALKVLPPGSANDVERRKRFAREARAAAALRHPNIVAVFDCGEAEGTLYYAMEYIDGIPLDRFLETMAAGRTEEIPEGLRCALGISSAAPRGAAGSEYCRRMAARFAEVADALSEAHRQGVVHRDVKPSNIIFDGGARLMLADFGLASVAQGSRLTRSRLVLGTPLYMSPEQMEGDGGEVDARSDIFSLGVTLYQCLALELPWSADRPRRLVHAICVDDPPPLGRRNPSAPPELEVIAAKCLEKSPRDRYFSAAQLAGDLRAAVDGGELSIRPTGAVTRWLRRVRRDPAPAVAKAALAALAVAAAAQGLYLALVSSERDRAAYEKLNLEAIDVLFSGGAESGSEPARSAIGILERAAALCPERPEAWFHLALAQHQMGSTSGSTTYDPSGAAVLPAIEPYLERALAAAPGYEPALLLKAQQLEQQGRAEEAARARERIPGIETRPAWRQWLAAELQFRRGAWDLAAAEFRRSVRGLDLPFSGYRHYAQLQIGTCLFAQFRFEEAIGALRIAQELAPARIVPGILLGKAWVERGDLRRAEEEFELALERAESPAEALAAIAWTWWFVGEGGRALRANERGLARFPRYPRLLTNRSVALGLWRSSEPAASLAESRWHLWRLEGNRLVPWLHSAFLSDLGLEEESSAVRGGQSPNEWFRGPTHFEFKVRDAVALLDQPERRAEAARSCLDRFRAGERKHRADAPMAAAVLLAALPEEEALAAARDLPAASAGWGSLELLLETYSQAGRRAEALALLDEQARAEPPVDEALALLGEIRFAEGDAAAALALFETGIARHPDVAAFHRGSARALAKLGRPLEAHERFGSALQLDPAYGDAAMEWKRIALSQGKAEDYFQTMVSLTPSSSDWRHLAALVRESRTLAERTEYWRAAADRHPNQAWPLVFLGECLAESRHLDLALERLEAGYRLRPFPAFGQRIADVVHASRHPRQAALYWERFRRREPADPEARWLLAEARLAAGDVDAALDGFLEALLLRPEDAAVFRLHRQLARHRLPIERRARFWSDVEARLADRAPAQAVRALSPERGDDSGPLRIDCGARRPHHDARDRHWSADRFFVGGTAARGLLPSMAGDVDERLSWSERISIPGDADALYAIPLPDGDYEVRVHVPGEPHVLERQFRVEAEGEALEWPAASTPGAPIALRRVVRVADGFLDLDARELFGPCRLLAIEVLPGSSTAGAAPAADPIEHARGCAGALRLRGDRLRDSGDFRGAVKAYRAGATLDGAAAPELLARAYGTLLASGTGPSERRRFLDEERGLPGKTEGVRRLEELEELWRGASWSLRINCGGGAIADGQGRVWSCDRFFAGGMTASTPLSAAGVAAPSIYQTCRRGERRGFAMSYAIPLPRGRYAVQLHLAATTWIHGHGPFDVILEGERVLAAVHPWKAPGFRRALRPVFTVDVADGVLEISLRPAGGVPLLSGIEVEPR